MLELTIPDVEYFDETSPNPDDHRFVKVKGTTIELEHSLISLSKWETKWKKPFLSKDEKTKEETIDYIRCMTMTKNVRPEIYTMLTQENHATVGEYITDNKTATWINDNNEKNKKRNNQVVTSELIYYWMIAHTIPWEAQRWHLSRLIMLIQVCNEKNKPKDKKKRRAPDYSKQNAMNKARRQAAGLGV